MGRAVNFPLRPVSIRHRGLACGLRSGADIAAWIVVLARQKRRSGLRRGELGQACCQNTSFSIKTVKIFSVAAAHAGKGFFH
jgi:hypothetical protein